MITMTNTDLELMLTQMGLVHRCIGPLCNERPKGGELLLKCEDICDDCREKIHGDALNDTTDNYGGSE